MLLIMCNFESFSSAMEWIIKRKQHDVDVLHILDNFLFSATIFHLCAHALTTFLDLGPDIGVPLDEENTVGPVTALIFSVIGLDTLEMSACILADKI